MNNSFHKHSKKSQAMPFNFKGQIKSSIFPNLFIRYPVFLAIFLVLSVTGLAQPLVPATDTMFQRYYPDLTVFIGTPVPNQSLNKDSSARWPNDPFMADGVLRVKYLVKEWVYGLEKPPDTLEMISYDHYSAFPFLDSKYAMLYVYKNRYGSYTQERYRYHNVYPTIGGGWAGPPEAWRWFRDSNHLVPKTMSYIDSVRVPMHVFEDSTYFPDELAEMQESFPSPYYYLNRFDMVTMYGNEAIELFNYEKSQLIASTIFDEKYVDENGVVSVPDVELAPANEEKVNQSPRELTLTVDQFRALEIFYYTLIRALKSDDSERLNPLLLPELKVCDSVWSRKAFSVKFLPQIKDRFQKYRDYNFEKLKAKQWKAWYAAHRKNYWVLKTGNEFENDWIKANLDFQNPQNELFVLENYYPQNEDQKEFYLHFVLRNGQFFLYGMHFTRMRHCYR